MNPTSVIKSGVKSWKTTVAGAVAALGVYFKSQTDMAIVGDVLIAVGTFLTGLFARDSDKSSEDVGAK